MLSPYYDRLTACTTAVFLALAPISAVAHDGALPLGDGNISTSPKVGYVFSCTQTFRKRPGPAAGNGPWIKGDVWYPAEKPALPATVVWQDGGSSVKLAGPLRIISSQSVPDHKTGDFPFARGSLYQKYDRNPNSIQEQSIEVSVPAMPMIAPQPTCLPMGPIGIALSGALIYNALDAEGHDAAAHEIQDECSGHPQRRGQYHYHSASPCLKEVGATTGGHSGLVGYAADGFGIFGPNDASGTAVTNENLDACHGHSETVIIDGKPQEIYHYHLTAEYPYSLGCFMGTPGR